LTEITTIHSDAQHKDHLCHAQPADAKALRNRCLVHDKYYHLNGVHEMKLPDPKSHFGADHQNIAAVLHEAEKLGFRGCCRALVIIGGKAGADDA